MVLNSKGLASSNFILVETSFKTNMVYYVWDQLVSNHQRFFGFKPKLKFHSPLEKGDHPELYTSGLLDPNGVQQYQSIIGSLQWAVSLV